MDRKILMTIAGFAIGGAVGLLVLFWWRSRLPRAGSFKRDILDDQVLFVVGSIEGWRKSGSRDIDTRLSHIQKFVNVLRSDAGQRRIWYAAMSELLAELEAAGFLVSYVHSKPPLLKYYYLTNKAFKRMQALG